eukprot:m.472503 g.472503  ORF g.472503 m.472503 type:complete len:228 (+) comp20384_c0_seq18:1058-1741(+)
MSLVAPLLAARWLGRASCSCLSASMAAAAAARLASSSSSIAAHTMGTDIATDPAALSPREFPGRPIAAVSVCCVDESPIARPKVLLVQRGKEPKIGSWSLPGGGIDVGEATLTAGKRELLEECGLQAGQHVLFHPNVFNATDFIMRDDQGKVKWHYVISQLFSTVVAGQTRLLSPGDDAAAVGWFSEDEVLDLQRQGLVAGDVAGVVTQAITLRRLGFLHVQSEDTA